MSSLRARLLLPIGVGLAVLVVAGGWFVHRGVRETLERGVDATLRDRARWWADLLVLEIVPEHRQEMEALGATALVEIAKDDVDPAVRGALLEAAERGIRVALRDRPAAADDEGEAWYEIRTGDGRIVARSPSLSDTAFETTFASEAAAPATTVALPGGRSGRMRVLQLEEVAFAEPQRQRAWVRIRGPARFPAHRATVVVARDTEEVEGFLRTLSIALVALLGALLALGFLLTNVVVRRGLAPLQSLRRQIAGLDEASLDERIRLASCPSELRPVVEALNDRLERLEEAFERERRTTAHIAHELRTPIAELRALTEVALTFPDDAQATADGLSGCRDAAEHMSRIVETVLRVARTRSGAAEHPPRRMDLAEVVSTAVRTHTEEAARRHHEMSVELEDDLTVVTDAEAVDTLLANLLGNAVQHAPEGSTIRVEGRRDRGAVLLRIANPSDSLTGEDLPHLVEPFWRKDAARTTSERGGLGLTLAHELARAFGLTLSLALEDGVFTACIAFPVHTGGEEAQA